ncbi:RNA-guided endonuclease IscB [Sinimarinibacterium sp. NLF-5-8]|uniref:RNA-guided endonuclease IscB n=1 Tax=Sinimarinibacterium sp. NLF-5-8 TaxID=2698684 RepID=UPI00137BD0EC|nr:RNA-guided endonuclease IscB [Sinimarinibacterium sp. NLF-5-8]QHS09134.1 HNH endonuclease [Sinimarinibacterium sp. NLF-5-8]
MEIQVVFVLDKRKRPLMPCTEKRARLMLNRGRAVVHKLHPFTIRLKDRVGGDVQPIVLKINPGSKTTGLAVVREMESQRIDEIETIHAVLWTADLNHRGAAIRKAMERRAGFRRRRRSANLRYRQPRFNNRTRPQGWLAPSLQHRVDTTMAWVTRLRKVTPISGVIHQLHRFDTQALQNPEISGVEYQQGTLFGYEVREYLLEKWERQCAYCNAKDTPLQIDHIYPKSKGGSNRISNLTLACQGCNQKKGALPVEQFLAGKPQVLKRIQARAKVPLKDAASVNATRWALFRALKATGLAIAVTTGARTKFNRVRLGIPKSHALDAACGGKVDGITKWATPTLNIRCTGRGAYQRTQVNASGFPRGHLMRVKSVRGFQTGDLARAVVPKGKNAGTHTGRVAVRATGSFNIQIPSGHAVQGISHRYCTLLQRADGYGYFVQPKLIARPEQEAARLAA